MWNSPSTHPGDRRRWIRRYDPPSDSKKSLPVAELGYQEEQDEDDLDRYSVELPNPEIEKVLEVAMKITM